MGVVCLPIVWIAQPNCLFVCLFLGHSNSYEELLASPRRCSSRPRKNCSSSPSSLLPLTERCPPESSRLGHNSPSSMPSSSARRPSWRTIYLTMLVVFLAFSLPTAGNTPISLSLSQIVLPVGHSLVTSISVCCHPSRRTWHADACRLGIRHQVRRRFPSRAQPISFLLYHIFMFFFKSKKGGGEEFSFSMASSKQRELPSCLDREWSKKGR